MPKKDLNQIAARITSLTTGEVAEPQPEKNPAAAALGRLGGLKGGKARAEKLLPEKRKEIAREAAISRWKTKNQG